MGEDDFLDAYMEDRLSGGDGLWDSDAFWVDQRELDDYRLEHDYDDEEW